MNLDVYDHTNTSFLGTLTEAHDIEFLDDLTIPGFARFQLDTAASADLALCRPRRIVRFRTGASPGDGDVFAAIIQDLPATLNDQMQPTDGLSTVTVDCRGLLAWLGVSEGGAVLYPQGGLDGRQQNPRVFGWQTQDFDDSGWGQVGSSMTAGQLSTEGWPDDQAVAFSPIFEGDRALYRRFLPALDVEDTSARMFLVATFRTEVKVWLDGELVLEKPRGQTGLFYEDVTYEDIDHQLAVEVSGGTGRWGWTWMSTDTTEDEDGNEETTTGAALRRTYDPAEFPNATPWLSFEGGPNDWQQSTFVPDDTWVRPVADGPLSTPGFPDSQAVGYFSEPGRGRFFRQIESSSGESGAVMTLVAEFNTSVRLFIDNTQVGYKPSGQRGLFEFQVDYPATDFVLSAVVVGGGRWGWTWQTSGGSTLRRTYNPETFTDADPWWYKPDDLPGVTTGFVLRTALDEDADRHPGRPWSYGFDGDQDSDAQPYGVTFSRGFRVQEVGRLVDELSSIEGEPHMTPDGTLRWLAHRGQDRTATVEVTSPFALDLSGRGPQATRWLYETQSGFGQALTDGPEDEFGVMERFVQLGSDISSQSIGAVVTSQVAREAALSDEVRVDLPDDVTPYVDVELGDTVACQGRDGMADVRLTSVQARVDDSGHVEWTATGKPA